jgi:hypothetical protein
MLEVRRLLGTVVPEFRVLYGRLHLTNLVHSKERPVCGFDSTRDTHEKRRGVGRIAAFLQTGIQRSLRTARLVREDSPIPLTVPDPKLYTV